MNKQAIRTLLALTCLLTSALAHPATALTAAGTVVAAPAAAHTAGGRHFLWRISKGRETLYLLGSIHALNPHDYPLPAEMETAFRHSVALVEEINLTAVNPASTRQEALRLGTYPQGKSLRTELPPAVYAQVAAGARKLGIVMGRLEHVRPWLGSIAVLDRQLTRAGFSPSDGVDYHFADEAHMLHKPVIGLETPGYQLRLLADLPAKVQREMLLESLHEAGNLNREMQDLINAWKRGDTAALEKIRQRDFGNYPLIYQLLVADRNRTWMPRLEHLLRSGRQYFVVVGALHMVGKDGLIARFEKAGYQVKQL